MRESRSRWFVGSSSARTDALDNMIFANAIRLCSPPLNSRSGRLTSSPVNSSEPRNVRASTGFRSGRSHRTSSNGVRERSRF